MTEEQAGLLDALRPLVQLHLSEEDGIRAQRIAYGMLKFVRRNANPEVKADAMALFDSLMLVGEVHESCHEEGKAISIYQEAFDLVEENEKVSPKDMVIYSLKQKLGTLLDNQGKSSDALPLLEGALGILERTEGSSQKSIANLCNNLGMTYRTIEEFSQAEQHYLRALEIFENMKGGDRLTIAAVLNNLGTLYWAWMQMEKARDFHLRAWDIRASMLVASHPDLGQSASNLAAVYHVMGEFGNASNHYERAIKILEQNVETDAETYEIVVQNYANLLKDHGKEPNADKLLNQCEKLLSKVETKTVA